MYSKLIKYCSQFVELTEDDKKEIYTSFKPQKLKRKELLLAEGEKCNFIAFINSGIIRRYHIKDGNEFTYDIVLSLNFITDIISFSQDIPSYFNFQVLKDVELLIISRKDLFRLYKNSKQIESLGKMMTELGAARNLEKAMTLASKKPEERVAELLSTHPELFQEVPQRYLASLIGITPESFSQIRARQLNKKS